MAKVIWLNNHCFGRVAHACPSGSGVMVSSTSKSSFYGISAISRTGPENASIGKLLRDGLDEFAMLENVNNESKPANVL